MGCFVSGQTLKLVYLGGELQIAVAYSCLREFMSSSLRKTSRIQIDHCAVWYNKRHILALQASRSRVLLPIFLSNAWTGEKYHHMKELI
jgi:hypothetical protein